MNLAQGIELGRLAKEKNYSVETEAGKVRLVTVIYDADGKPTVTPHTGWMTYEEAKIALA